MASSRNVRVDNLLASLTLNLAEHGQAAMESAAGLTGSGTAALLAFEELLAGAHVGKVADVLGLTHSGAVRLIDLLEREGLVERRPGSDRRRVEVRLTARGRQRARQARAARDEVIRAATDTLSAGEVALLEGLLEKLVAGRVAARMVRRRQGETGAWWCRTCDFAACGRPEGRCPAQVAAARTTDL